VRAEATAYARRVGAPEQARDVTERSMRFLVRIAAVAALAATASLAASCGSDSADVGSSSSAQPAATTWADSEPVNGDVTVAWENLDPNSPAHRIGLVNESSATGQKLKSGKATSSEIRVLTDAEMGGLLAKLAELNFFKFATDGVGLDNAPDVPGRKGIVVVTQNGDTKGLFFRTNLGEKALADAYVESKKLVFAIHSQLPGYDVKASLGASDERIFSAPPIKPKKP
jgi:hypothetical protein